MKHLRLFPDPATGAASAPASTGASLSAPATPPAASTPPPAASTPPPAATGGAPASAPSDWLSSVGDAGLKSYITDTKQFKDVGMMADAYRNLEKLVGVPQDKLLRFPEALRDDKGVLTSEARAVFEKLGAPKEAKDYGLKLQEGGDQKRLDSFTKVAHEIGLSPWQVEALNNMDSAYVKGLSDAQGQARADAFKADDASIRREWGAAYDQNRNLAAEGMKKMGWDNAKVDKISSSLGHAETMKMLHALGSATGEASYVRGSAPDPIHTPATASARIQELIKTPGFFNRLESGDLEARRLWNKYNEEAAAGQTIPV